MILCASAAILNKLLQIKMISKYTELILWMSILGTILTGYLIFLVVNLSKTVDNLTTINKLLTKENRRLDKENNLWRTDAPKILKVGELNANNIKDLKEQVFLINKWLVDVLNISSLIPAKEAGIEASDIIDQLKQNIKWNEEIARRRDENENDFYKGD